MAKLNVIDTTKFEDMAVDSSRIGNVIYYYDNEGDLIYTYNMRTMAVEFDPDFISNHQYD